MTLRDEAEAIWRAGVAAAHGGTAVERWLDAHGHELDAERSVWVLGAGKAVVPMALPIVERLGARLSGGLLATKDGHGGPVTGLGVVEAAHPVPDRRGVEAADRSLAIARQARADELVLVLLSGGASALWAAPRPGHSLEAIQARTAELLRSGADIEGINAERASWSRIKGGALARAAHPARVRTLVLCDVPGDPWFVGSGPTEGTPLEVVADHRTAQQAAAAAAAARGYRPVCVDGSGPLDRVVAHLLSARAPGVAVIAAGESTIEVTGDGVGGRNQHLALDVALRLAGREGWALCAGGTDGTDGPTPYAGGVVDGTTAREGAGEALRRFDSGTWLQERGHALVTGPTGTNVMDLHVLLVK